jgi:hypothetical protein
MIAEVGEGSVDRPSGGLTNRRQGTAEPYRVGRTGEFVERQEPAKREPWVVVG